MVVKLYHLKMALGAETCSVIKTYKLIIVW
jgi:hypothetical protein